MTDDEFMRAFEELRIPPSEWRHRDHIRIAYIYLSRFSFEAAFDRMRRGLIALNKEHKIPDVPTRGYHETITLAWLRLVRAAMRGAYRDSIHFCDDNPHLLSSALLGAHYTPERLAGGKAAFVDPDLSPLP